MTIQALGTEELIFFIFYVFLVKTDNFSKWAIKTGNPRSQLCSATQCKKLYSHSKFQKCRMYQVQTISPRNVTYLKNRLMWLVLTKYSTQILGSHWFSMNCFHWLKKKDSYLKVTWANAVCRLVKEMFLGF